MHIVRNCVKHKSGKIYRSILVRESYRENGKVKKRTVFNLSKWSEKDISLFDAMLKAKANNQYNFSNFEVIQGKSIGSVFVLHEVAKQLGIVEALGSSFQAKLALWLIFARILEQGSRLSATRLDSLYDIASIIELGRGFDENDLYECLNWLHQNQNKIEDFLFKNKNKKSNQFYWYDVTSSYLEGIHNELAAFGYNRDKKTGKRIIVIGLLTKEHGDPVSIEAFKGNTQDTQTFESQLIKLKTRFGCKSVTIISDRGLIKDKQKKLLKSYGFHYITAVPMPTFEALIKEKIILPESFTEKLKSVFHKGCRYIYRRNPQRALEAERCRHDRFKATQAKVNLENQRLLKENSKVSIEASKKKLQKMLDKLCLSEWVSIIADGRQFSLLINEEKLKESSKFDGCYIWTTDLTEEELNDQEIYERYKDLKYVEDDFRSFKSEFLEVRPVFVRTEKSTRGHLVVVMLAHMILRKLRQAWSSFNQTVGECLTELSMVCRNKIKFSDSNLVECIPQPNERILALLNALSLKMPKAIDEKKVPVVTRMKVRKNAKN